MNLLNNSKLLLVMILIGYLIYMISEFNLLYSDYIAALERLNINNLPQVIREITQLQHMYTILPEQDEPLTPLSINIVYYTHVIINYKYFLYHHNSMAELQNMVEQNPILASKLTNVIKQDIINSLPESNLLITDIFVKQAIKLADPFSHL
uniref:Uncharacterized protein n=1 Tax=Cantharellus appalachiensis TaxID=409893 RepID=A0A2S0S445_9AGAM|nr:hypothetical protein [Cantharellus appalachiensis]AWA82116.1 hypothetical protein [Cantharellus appalachiensis]